MNNLSFHHTGLLVDSIEESQKHYAEVFGVNNISQIYHVESQQVKVCFIQNGENSYLELVQPNGEDSPVNNMLKKRISYYHVAYLTEDIHDSIRQLELLNYKAMSIFSSEAFNGRDCVFMFTPDGHLIELIEKEK